MSRPITAPRLETERLVLRGFTAEDFEDFAALHADAEVMRHINGGTPMPREQSWLTLTLYVGHWPMRGYGFWAVTDKATGAFLGRAGLWRPEGWPGLELGWALKRDAWGRGFATEASAEALRFARRELGLGAIVSLIQDGNDASVRVAEKLGARRAGVVSLYGQAMNAYAYPNAFPQDR